MDLLHLVDRLEELVASAQKMPIGSRAIVDRRRLLDIVDQMRIAVPREVREAQDMMVRRDMLEREAEEEARMIIARAEQDAAALAEDHAITEAARRRAGEIVESAELRLQERIDEANREIQDRLWESRGLAEQQMAAADAYAKELLERLERQLQAFVRSVRAGIEQLDETQPDEPPRATEEFEQAINDQRGASPTTAPLGSDTDYPPRRDDAGSWEAQASGDFIPPVSYGDDDLPRGAPSSEFDFEDAPDVRSYDEPREPETPDRESPRDRHRGSIEDAPGPRATARQVPLHASSTRRATLDLENMLFREAEIQPARPRNEAPAPEAAAPGVIDDFDLPGLDDDPTQRRSSRDS